MPVRSGLTHQAESAITVAPMRRTITALLVTLAALAVPASASAIDRYAKNGGASAGTCSTPATACSLPVALTAASAGDVVLVDAAAGPITVAGLSIGKPVSLRPLDLAGPRPVITGTPTGPTAVIALTAAATGANLSGLDVRSTAAASAGPAVSASATGAIIQDSLLTSNGAGLVAPAGRPTVRRTIIRGVTRGASMSGTLVNSIATATGTAGAAAVEGLSGTSLTAVNVTAIAPNAGAVAIRAQPASSSPGSDGAAVTVRNTIARGTAADVEATTGSLAIDHSAVATTAGAGVTQGPGNITADPRFVSATDLHLQATSPAIDAGVPDPLSAPVDLEGAPRVVGAAPDLGAYELRPPIVSGPVGPQESPAVPDGLAPTLSTIRLSATRFRVAEQATAVSAAARRRRAPAGTTIAVTVSEPVSLSITIDRLLPGRRSGRACVAPTRALARAKRCTRTSTQRPVLVRALRAAGRASIPFTGRLGTHALAIGRYRLTATAADAAGNGAPSRTATFTIVRR